MTTIIDGTGGVTFPAGGVGNPASAVVGLTDTQTLTNKSIVATQLTGTIASARLPTGSVLQVVQGTYAIEVSSSTSTYIDTGLTASITPSSSSSKILVLVSQNGIQKRTTDTYMGLQLQRGGSSIAQIATGAAGTGTTAINDVGTVAIDYLDSPATTSSTTYKTQFRSTANSAICFVQKDSVVSTITLMEIAA